MARSPGPDAFWMYRRAFARFVGSGTGNALEVGCGEGRISRDGRFGRLKDSVIGFPVQPKRGLAGPRTLPATLSGFDSLSSAVQLLPGRWIPWHFLKTRRSTFYCLLLGSITGESHSRSLRSNVVLMQRRRELR
jgi:hypothetical protein